MYDHTCLSKYLCIFIIYMYDCTSVVILLLGTLSRALNHHDPSFHRRGLFMLTIPYPSVTAPSGSGHATHRNFDLVDVDAFGAWGHLKDALEVVKPGAVSGRCGEAMASFARVSWSWLAISWQQLWQA